MIYTNLSMFFDDHVEIETNVSDAHVTVAFVGFYAAYRPLTLHFTPTKFAGLMKVLTAPRTAELLAQAQAQEVAEEMAEKMANARVSAKLRAEREAEAEAKTQTQEAAWKEEKLWADHKGWLEAQLARLRAQEQQQAEEPMGAVVRLIAESAVLLKEASALQQESTALTKEKADTLKVDQQSKGEK